MTKELGEELLRRAKTFQAKNIRTESANGVLTILHGVMNDASSVFKILDALGERERVELAWIQMF